MLNTIAAGRAPTVSASSWKPSFGVDSVKEVLRPFAVPNPKTHKLIRATAM